MKDVKIRLGNLELTIGGIGPETRAEIWKCMQRAVLVPLNGPVLRKEQADILIDIAFLAITSQYPEMTREDIEQQLEVSNTNDIIHVIFQQCGFKPDVRFN